MIERLVAQIDLDRRNVAKEASPPHKIYACMPHHRMRVFFAIFKMMFSFFIVSAKVAQEHLPLKSHNT